MSWLVTGGAGYIGAHVVRALVADGRDVVVLDDLSTGEAPRVRGVAFIEGSVLDRDKVRFVAGDHKVHGIIHIAAKKRVAESVSDPLRYWHENVGGLVSLVSLCREQGINCFLFSSSAATYGLPDVNYVDEDTPCVPMSPYGETKLVGEWILRDCMAAFGLRAVALRYFNVAGAALPELADPGAFNLVPIVFNALTKGERPQVFGTDYPTLDGTCIRDYVHVADVARAHVAAVKALDSGVSGGTYNVGRGDGASVLEVLEVVGKVTGMDVTHDEAPRRPGDPARVVAAVDRIRADLGFQARYGLEEIVRSAWDGWCLRHHWHAT